MEMNPKGQAAITDALYFLVIVSGLATMLFVFSSGYGLSVAEATKREYQSDFSSSAMKTILYSSTPRDPRVSLDQSNEVDYLLATVKEDYADDAKIDESLTVLRDNIVGIMEPFADNFDYMFYIYIPDKREFPVLMLYVSSWAVNRTSTDPRKVVPSDPKADEIIFCYPKSLDSVDLLLAGIGAIYQSNSRIQLLETKPGGGAYTTSVSQVNLSMWTATALPEGVLGPEILNCNPKCSARKTATTGALPWQAC